LYQACKLLDPSRKNTNIHLGGNFDVPLSGLLLRILQEKTTEQQHLIILECSSFMLWQLQYFTFNIGILLNIAPDHIDRHGTMKDYLQSKVNILVHSQINITNNLLKQDIMKDQMR
jgi:UDP-N-acetylmuramoylalanine--D-glutamate ligase